MNVLLLNNRHKITGWIFRYSLPLVSSLVFCFLLPSLKAQKCPANIDFEKGNFEGWICYVGYTSAVGDRNVITLNQTSGPIPDRQTLYRPGNRETDFFGGFPVHCPNGSGNSIRLGSTEAGGQAEGVSYQFTIPADENTYSLTYYYAVVFQSPNHRYNEQPRMETEIFNVSDGKQIDCASFSFVAVGSSLPGFKVSNRSDTIDVLYKEWTPVTVDLSGNAGKTIRLFFKTADCTFRRHFGYAYIDVNSECNNTLVGSSFCKDDTLINIVAPYGFKSYSWYDSTVSNLLGNGQTLKLAPPPPTGSSFAVKMEPYPGYGCPGTLITKVFDTLTVNAHAGPDHNLCRGDTVQLGEVPKAGLAYKWTPNEGLNNPNIANPYIGGGFSGNYILTASNSGGGCRSTDTVKIISSQLSTKLDVLGRDAYCFGHGDTTILKVKPQESIVWFKDDEPIISASNQASYRVTVSGIYSALVTDVLGCKLTTDKKPVLIDYDVAGINYPVKYAIKNLPLPLKARPIGEKALWGPFIYLDSAASFNPTFRSTSEQFYAITITSKGGCVTTDHQLVKIVDKVEIYVPTAFSPNYDGRNDYLHPILRGIAEIRTFRIFDRWGHVLFDSKNEIPGWDGSFKGMPQPPQAVIWMLECVGLDGVVYSRKGSTVLVR